MLRDLTAQELADLVGLDIPLTDEQAWRNWPTLNWVYNKMRLCESQAIACAPIGVYPRDLGVAYPICVKQIYNLTKNDRAIKIKNDRDYEALGSTAGFWMPWFQGKTYSIMVVLCKGILVCCQAKRTWYLDGLLLQWESVNEMPKEALGWLRQLKAHTGCVTLDLIGDKIVSVHLTLLDMHQFASVRLFREIKQALDGQQPMHSLPSLFCLSVWTPADFPLAELVELQEASRGCRLLLTEPRRQGSWYRQCQLVSNDFETAFQARRQLLDLLEKKACPALPIRFSLENSSLRASMMFNSAQSRSPSADACSTKTSQDSLGTT